MWSFRHSFLAVLLLCVASVPLWAADAPKRVAIFDVTFLDTSTEGAYGGVREDELARLAAHNAGLRAAFEERGYELLALDPVQDVIDRTVNPAQCNNCEIRMGKTLEADLVVTSEIQKVSNLILTFNIMVRDVKTGQRVRAGAVDIRGNNESSWKRGLSYLLRNRIFRDGKRP